MKITTHLKQNAFGHTVNYKLYEPLIPSKNYLICYHGKGELGPIDGSLIDRVEVHGYPKHAKSFEFPFNIIAPQAQTSYYILRKIIPAYVKLKYQAEAIIVTGLSLGGYATFDTPLFDEFNLVHAIAPVCGGISASFAPDYPEIRGWACHGDRDTVVPYTRSKQFVEKYNETHTHQFGYTLYSGVAHNAWDRAYDVDGELLGWINQQFAQAPKTVKQKLLDFIISL